ncbi:hypothetical protein [Leptospira saintgironsiae]|uniref:Uncharacterized protein n=1 Tax=Leptospira saintgironsiae TaxID=2023183 RepID=A0A2M9Y7T4_9LEPT|nr:hypothetical protein [Leptospira saintgironsiae]PJZ47607.1 hypothetical protein CH362_18405 [Leptospira saintgironsiae]
MYRILLVAMCLLIFLCKDKQSENEIKGKSSNENIQPRQFSIYGIPDNEFTNASLRDFVGSPRPNNRLEACLEISEENKLIRIIYSDFKSSESKNLSFNIVKESVYSVEYSGKTLYLRKYMQGSRSRLLLTFSHDNVDSEQSVQAALESEKAGISVTYGTELKGKNLDRCYLEMLQKVEFQKEQKTFGEEEAKRHREGK